MAQVTVATGFDVDYYLDQVGADYYLTAAGEPPGHLGRQGRRGPRPARPGRRRQGQRRGDARPCSTTASARTGFRSPPGSGRRSTRPGPLYAQVEEAIAKRIAALGRFATPEERREIRLQERAKMRTSTPYYDMTFSAEKSVSLLYAGAAGRGEAGAGRGRRAGGGAVPSGRRAGRSGGDGRRGPDAGGGRAARSDRADRASQREQRRVPRRRGARGGEVPAAHQPGR